MPWTEKEISDFQIINKKTLQEVNATLRPDNNLSGKIGIGLPGQAGDLMTGMSILKYRKEIFAGKEIVWFAHQANADCLKYSPISEVRPWPWANNGLPAGTPDLYPLVCDENNRLNKEVAKYYEMVADLEEMYFPAPWMLLPQKRHGIDYPNCSKKVFGIDQSYEWHPLLCFSDEERKMVDDFIEAFPKRKNVLMETFAGSDQSKWDHSMTENSIRLAREKWGDCNFFMASHKYLRAQENFPENFFDQEGVYSCAHFTPRLFALLNDYMDLIISVSSGITVACSAWGTKPVAIAQYCGSWICSTASLAKGRQFELITTDNKLLQIAQAEFGLRLEEILNQYK